MKPLPAGLLLSCLLLSASAANAVDIIDNAKFFSKDALKRANVQIAEIERKHNTEVRIETFASVPENRQAELRQAGASGRADFFAKWLADRAQEVHSKGVFMLINRDPGHARVDVTAALRNRGFGDAQRDAVTKPLLAEFGKKNHDAGLALALGSLDRQLGNLSGSGGSATAQNRRGSEPLFPGKTVTPSGNQEHARPVQHAPQGGGISWMWLLILLVGGFLVLRMIGRLFRSAAGGAGGGYAGGPGYGGQPSGGPGYGGGFGGGGRGLLGGLLGGMAGGWLYDQFSGRHAQGGNYTPSRNDYQDSGTSSSFGGGDFGGGDFSGSSGGGDFSSDSFSGGGDFGGGGGGDFSGGGDSGGGDFG